jgi:hypothetical protein
MFGLVGFSREEVSTFFEILKQLMERYKFSGDRIYNCDETGISTVQKLQKVVAERGRKQVERVT